MRRIVSAKRGSAQRVAPHVELAATPASTPPLAVPFNMRLIRVSATPTSTGTQSYTVSGFGTPVGAILVASWGDTEDTLEPGAGRSVGFTDGSDALCSFSLSRNNVATTVAKRGGYDDRLLALKNPADGTLDVSAEFSQWVTDGIELNFTVADKAVVLDILLIGGTDAAAKAWYGPATTTTPTFITIGFQTDFVLTSTFFSTDGTDNEENHWMSGIATRINPTEGNCSIETLDDDGVSTSESVRGSWGDRLATTYIVESGPNSVGAGAKIDSYSSTGFNLSGDVGIAGDGPPLCGIAVRVGPSVSYGLQINELSPGSTGTQAKTWPGFFPGFLIFSHGSMDGTGAYRSFGSGGLGYADFVDQGSQQMMVAHNVTTSNTQSLASSHAIDTWTHSASAQLVAADVVARGSSGYTLDWVAVTGTARVHHVLAIEFLVQLEPDGIPSAESFGTATIATSIAVEPTGIVSAESFGTPAIRAVTQIQPGGIVSAEAFGTAEIAVGKVALSPTGIVSAEAHGTPTVAAGAVQVEPGGILSAESFGTPDLRAYIVVRPDGIASAEAFGNAIVLPGAVAIQVDGIGSAEAFGTANVQRVGENLIVPDGIGSAESFGVPFVRGGLIIVTLKKRIYDAICSQIRLATFVAADYDAETCTLVQGLQVAPASIEVNELDGSYKVDERHGRMFKQDYVRWQWLAIVRFDEEVICEPFEREWLEDPPCLHRTETEDRQARLLLLNATYSHPPREGASNGTEARYHFGAALSPR